MNPGEESPRTGSRAKLSEQKRRLLEQRLNRSSRSKGAKSNGIPRRPPGSKTLASLGQSRIWLLNEINPNSPTFNLSSSFEIKGTINCSVIESALNRVIQRHEVLRSRYLFEDSELIQHTEESLHFSIERILCNVGDSIEDAAQDFVRIPFKLDSLPLLRMGIFSESQHRHILSLSVHHIIFDEWSIKLFWKEFNAFYENELTGNSHSLSELPIQYPDFSHWQRKWLSEGEGDRQLSYWEEKLKEPPPPIPFATDRPYSNEILDSGSLERSTLPAVTAKGLRELAANQDASPFMILLLGFNILLSRYTNTFDLLVSSPVANRRKRETADLIGFFLNTIILRTDLSGDPTVFEALGRVKKTSLEAFTSQDLPPDAIVDAIKPKRVPGRHPLFQTMFVFQSGDEGKPHLGLHDCEVTPTLFDTGTSKFDICLFVTETSEGMDAVAEYRTDIFEAETMGRLLAHYSKLMESLVRHPERRISELDILSKSDLSDLLVGVQGESAPTADTRTVSAQIAGFAISNPDGIALSGHPGTNITYDVLEQQVTRLAEKLVEEGAGTGIPVAIYMDQSPGALVSVLAILKSGSPYVPIDPSTPDKRCAAILNDAKPSAIITDAKYRERLGQLIDTTLVDPEKYEAAPTRILPAPNPEDTAYLIYTSGSTGVPKGVIVTHSNLRDSTFARRHYYSEHPDRFLLLSSLAFDSSVAGIFWTLTSGKTLVIPESGAQRDPDVIRRTIHKNRVTTILCVPGIYREIIESGSDNLDSLRTVIVAGETCHPTLVSRHYHALPACSLYNEYGPTEATVWCTVAKLNPNEPVTIGSTIPNYGTYVLSEGQQLLPVGIPGELYISGPGVTKGYLNNQTETDQKFVSVSLPDASSKRMYRTGDRVRRLIDGSLEFLGRLDGQVKIRGYRVEIGEIEHSLNTDDNIIESVVHALEETIDDCPSTRLIAFVKLRDRGSFDERETKRRLSSTLAEYAVPAQFVVLDEIPHLSNGKVDKNSLPIPDRGNYEVTEIVEPANSTEKKLVEIWKQVLELKEISATANFFDLGGHSLLALKLVRRIRDELQVKFPVRYFFEYPTIRRVAEKLEDSRSVGLSTDAWRYLVPLQSKGDRRPLFLFPGGIGSEREFLVFARLAEFVGKNQPIFGLRATDAQGEEPIHQSVTQMAEDYVREIRAMQPLGPYQFLGECVGGIVAFEAARQLAEQGEVVSHFILMDSICPRRYDHLLSKLSVAWLKFRRHWATELVTRSVTHLFRLIRMKPRDAWAYIKNKSRMGKKRVNMAMLARDETVESELLTPADHHYFRTLIQYRPKNYRGSMCLMLSEEMKNSPRAMSWAEWVQGGVTVRDLEGDHFSCIRDNAPKTAVQIREYFEC